VTRLFILSVQGIVGGQTLAAVSTGNLSWSVGIVIISVIALVVSSFSDYPATSTEKRTSWSRCRSVDKSLCTYLANGPLYQSSSCS
jgi:hypothetical protein